MSVDTKRRLSQAAARQFLTRGYAGTSLSSIAEQLGLTKGAFAFHFRTKADFAEHFREITNSGAAQAEAYSEEAYPDQGVQRLVLFFLVLSSWQLTEPRFAAGLALFTDKAAPNYQDPELMGRWSRLAERAFVVADQQGIRDPHVTPVEAANFFLAATLGAATHRYGPTYPAEPHPTSDLPFAQQALVGCGVRNAHDLAAEVLERHATSLPALHCPGES